MTEALDPWPFVAAAYALGVLGTALLTGWTWAQMRRAESRREESRRGGRRK